MKINLKIADDYYFNFFFMYTQVHCAVLSDNLAHSEIYI